MSSSTGGQKNPKKPKPTTATENPPKNQTTNLLIKQIVTGNNFLIKTLEI